jgi:hypothetical protein
MTEVAKLTDEDFLSIVQIERQQSVGFDNDQELMASREKALQYIKGEMKDVPSLPNRSSATSSDIADAVETVLPDLIEIFIGEDVATFQPHGQEDEDLAAQETDYVKHVFFNLNNGFLNLETGFKDALQTKLGVWKWWWEEEDEEDETFEGKSEDEYTLAAQDGRVTDLKASDDTAEDGSPLYDFTIAGEKTGRLKVQAIPPEDFTVSADTIRLSDAVYCAHRSRPRAQDLIACGFDAKKVADLPPYAHNDITDQARDGIGETQTPHPDAGHNLHRVEIVEHLIRVDALNKGRPQLWKVTTGGDETVLLDKEQVDDVNYAAITPFAITHRLHGWSVSDKLMEIQRINTSLTRMALDQGYFALNQRLYVDETACTANTITDLLRNEPGVPVRGKGPNAIQPIQSGGLNFDVMGLIEHMKTVAESRTGAVRNAQGLNPDTLHDTAKGAMALMSMAQKRIRYIARRFAETGVKDMFIGIHAMLRKHSTKDDIARLRGQWVKVSPTKWAERKDMDIEIGLGSAGREHDLMIFEKVIGLQTQAITEQGGLNGPFVTGENLYNATSRFLQRAGMRNPELFFTNPGPPKQEQPKPDPKMMEAQAKLQIQQQSAQADAQLQQQKAQQSSQLDQAKAQADLEHRREQAAMDAQIQREKHALDLQLKQQTTQAELAMKQWQIEQEFALKAQQMERDHELQRETAHRTHEVNMAKASRAVQVGGEPG